MSQPEFGPCPPRFADIKQEIASSYPGFEKHATESWADILTELDKATRNVADQSSEGIPQIEFSDLTRIEPSLLDTIRRKGCVVIRNVVDDAEARAWKEELGEYVKTNPVEGYPENDKQFFQLYWTKPQVRARAHPNVLTASVWLHQFYHGKNQGAPAGVDLSTPLSYADRFRIRRPGSVWHNLPPHIDGGSIERWEDEAFRSCFDEIFRGDWREHDPYNLERRIDARSSLYQKANKTSIFRAFQGWLALSDTAPSEGTLQVFPNLILSNAYIILRPFFTPVSEDLTDSELFDPKNWKFNTSTADFPGIFALEKGFSGPRPNTKSHPHLRLETAMISVPRVAPGDMVFWHCDLIHAVEAAHTGTLDSCVMYIPAVPYTPANAAYISHQKESFLKGVPPTDFPQWQGEAGFVGVGTPDDIVDPVGRKAMGFTVEAAA